MIHKKKFTDEVSNITLSQAKSTSQNLSDLIIYKTKGDFWEILDSLKISLVISREYEHFLVILGSQDGLPYQSTMTLPHPSGAYFNSEQHELVVSSTRTPNQIIFFQEITEENYKTQIINDDFEFPTNSSLFIPYKSIYLPGDFRIHDVVISPDNNVYITVTEHNFLAKVYDNGQWELVWSPECLDDLKTKAFHTNYLQLNSIALGTSIQSSYLTAFSNQVSGYKPWKEGYGPKGKGVIFSYETRNIICDKLTCPHSAKLFDDELWLCNSGYGTVGIVSGLDVHKPSEKVKDFLAVSRPLNGFTRGLAFYGDYVFVGLSKVIASYEPYAPGLNPEETVCGIVVLNTKTGDQVASLIWPNGYQVYDIQAIPLAQKCLLPSKPFEAEINSYLRYLG